MSGRSSLRRRWTHRFALILVLSLLSGAASVFVVMSLADSLRQSAAELGRESTLMIDLREALGEEDMLAHQLVDQGSVVASQFLVRDADVTDLLARARRTYNSSSELALVEQIDAAREVAYADLRPVAADPVLADRFGRELADKEGFHRGMFPKQAAIGLPVAQLDAVSRDSIHDRLGDAKTAEHRLIGVLGGLFLLLAALTVRLARRLSREVLAPIDQLSESAREFAGGQLDHRVRVVGTDEFSQLATQFNDMAAAIASSQRHLTTQAHYDHLTGLLNRAQFGSRLDDTFAQARDAPVWIAFIDLDDFKHVNDSAGHQAGDEVLRQVANRLLAATRSLDVVARLGGDEFAIIFATDADQATAELVARRVLEALDEPMTIFGEQHHVAASVGLASRDHPAITTDMLIRRADVAMYTAKGRGKNCWECYDPDVHGQLSERRMVDLSRDLL